jgi:uncharacterized membrane protein YphA (DoxX/SURF4 family)
MKIFRRTTALETIIVLFVILFLYTGISKIMDYAIFKEQIAMSPLLAPVAHPIAAVLPWVEFAVVLLLIIPRLRLKGLYASLGLMIAFTIYILAMLAFNKDIPCSCGGVIELLSWDQHIIFNAVFIILAGIGCWLERHQLQENRQRLATFHQTAIR